MNAVLSAARKELARIGYRGLRIEDVALRAKVNKTTIYRRWPTKVELVRETLRSMVEEHDKPIATGTLRGDLMAVAHGMLAFLRSASGQALVRMMMTEGTEADLREIVDSLRRDKESSAEKVFERAKQRGEIRKDVDCEMMLCTMVGSLHHKMFALGISPSQTDLDALVDLILYGVAPRAAKRKA
ncbi:MAG: TetR/AcrR family transcriptional regulator [Polyangiaceae bacterium]